MAVFRRKRKDPRTGAVVEAPVWWYEFTFAGRRIRESAKTTRKTIAIEAEKQRRLQLEKRLAGIPEERITDRIRSVSEVLKSYENGYRVNHRPKAVSVVVTQAKHLKRHLGGLLLPDVTQERILAYMAVRQKEKASGRTINIELGILARAMGNTWRAFWPKVKKLDERTDVGRALEAEQEKAILEAAHRNRSRMIYPYLMTLVWTGMRADEARTLRWSQVDIEGREIRVGKAKTTAGAGRTIPMSTTLLLALQAHAGWIAGKLGPIQPEWHLFPLSNRIRPVDPLKPMTSFKTAWDTVRTEAKVQCRIHDLRHSFCTKLAEAGVPESTMLDIMGHVSAGMLRRYSHIRVKARREAIDAIENGVQVGVPTKSPTSTDTRTTTTVTTI